MDLVEGFASLALDRPVEGLGHGLARFHTRRTENPEQHRIFLTKK